MVDAMHGPVVALGSPESDDAIEGADYLVAVKVGSKDEPVAVRVLLKPPLTAMPTTDLSYKDTLPAGAVLHPEEGKLLQLIQSDGTVLYCTNVGGRWLWLSLQLTAMST